jgi:RNA polymerase sigma factor (TIGR02999 family)
MSCVTPGEQSDPNTADRLLPLVYGELRKLAAHRLANEKPGQTLDATALVHEAYLRLASKAEGRHWDGRGHFFAAAAEAMQRILIENARRKMGPRRGGRMQRVDADLALLASDTPSVDILVLDEALTKLAAESPARAELVKLRFFAGLSVPEAAEVLGISLATAERHWTYSRTWLYAELSEHERRIVLASSPDPIAQQAPKSENRENS